MNTLLRFSQLALALGFSALVPAQAFGQPVHDPNAVAGVDAVQPPTDTGWTDIKNDTYEQRAHCEKGVAHLSAKLDDQIRELRAKRADMTKDTAEWDFTMKEVEDARTLLTGRITNLVKATTPEVWLDARDKVGEAWQSSQDAVDKMNRTRTS